MKKLVLSGVVFDASKTHNMYTYDKDCIHMENEIIPLINDVDTILGNIKIWIDKTDDGYDKIMGECEIIIDDNINSYISDLVSYSTININHGLTFCLHAIQTQEHYGINIKEIIKMIPSMVSIIPRHLNSDPTQSQINISLRRVKDENNT